MKVLHILDHSIPLHSGYAFRTRSILLQQQALGWDTVQVTGDKQPDSGELAEVVNGLLFHRMTSKGLFGFRLPGIKQVRFVLRLRQRILELIELEQPDVLHAHSPGLNGMAAVLAGRASGLPVLYECRAFWEDAAVDHGTMVEGGFRYRVSRLLETWVFRRADSITTICEGMRSEMATRGIAPSKIELIPNAVDSTHFSFRAPVQQELQARLELRDKKVLGFIGSFSGYEGIAMLISAMPRLLARCPDLRLLLVGEGLEAANIERLVKSQGLEDIVLLTGRIPHQEVQHYYSLVDIMVYPRVSMRITELVTPLKPLEAMARGNLVVASDVGGHRELIEDGKTGRLFSADDPDALTSVVLDLLGKPESWPDLRQNARRFVEDNRNWRNSVGRYEAIYRALLSDREALGESAL